MEYTPLCLWNVQKQIVYYATEKKTPFIYKQLFVNKR
jgi:hypothetical protein